MVRSGFSLTALAFVLAASGRITFAQPAGATLLGLHFDTGDIYGVSTADAATTFLGSTGIVGLGALEFGPDGALYGFVTSEGLTVGTMYRFDPVTYAPTSIGPMNIGEVFEGSLAFGPDGTLYGTNSSSDATPTLFTVDLLTGAATAVGVISGGVHDINALTWRDSDGMLIGIDRVTNSVLAIDPTTAAASVLAPIDVAVGSVGGLAVFNGVAYLATGGPGGPVPGSNELRTLDLSTGATALVGSLFPNITGSGLGGLAAVPEPTTMLLLLAGGAACLRPRRR